MLEIIRRIKNPEYRGLHLLYSAFRTLEGIGIFQQVLEEHGFQQFKIKTTSGKGSFKVVDSTQKTIELVYEKWVNGVSRSLYNNIYIVFDSTFTFSKQLSTTQEYKIRLEFSYTNLVTSGSAIKFIVRWSSTSQSLALINSNILVKSLFSSRPVNILNHILIGIFLSNKYW